MAHVGVRNEHASLESPALSPLRRTVAKPREFRARHRAGLPRPHQRAHRRAHGQPFHRTQISAILRQQFVREVAGRLRREHRHGADPGRNQGHGCERQHAGVGLSARDDPHLRLERRDRRLLQALLVGQHGRHWLLHPDGFDRDAARELAADSRPLHRPQRPGLRRLSHRRSVRHQSRPGFWHHQRANLDNRPRTHAGAVALRSPGRHPCHRDRHRQHRDGCRRHAGQSHRRARRVLDRRRHLQGQHQHRSRRRLDPGEFSPNPRRRRQSRLVLGHSPHRESLLREDLHGQVSAGQG